MPAHGGQTNCLQPPPLTVDNVAARLEEVAATLAPGMLDTPRPAPSFALSGGTKSAAATRWPAIVGLALSYFLAGKIGLHFASVNPSATAIWAPTGIALAGFLLCGYRVWPAIAIAAFLVNLTTAGSIATSVALAAGNTLEGLIGAYLINRFADGPKVFEKTKDILRFLVLAAMVSTMVSATIGVTSLCVAGYARWSQYSWIWFTWWLGDAGGDLIIAPLLLLWSTNFRVTWIRHQAREAALLLLALAAIGGVVFGGWTPLATQRYPLDFVCVPILLWAAFRFGPRETSTVTFLLSMIAIVGTSNGFGPFAQGTPNEAFLLLQAFLGVTGLMSIAVAIEVAERRRLDETRARLAAIVDSSDDAIVGKTLEGQITSWNASAERIFGFSPAEAIGKPINIIIPAPRLAEEAEVLARLRRGEAIKNFETVRVRKDGRHIDVSLTVSPIRSGDGRIIGVSKIARDITEPKRVRQEREELLHSEQIAHIQAEKTLSMLRRLQMVTDTALSKLTQEELMRELLARLRAALDADTATILLLEPDGEHLTPIQTAGIREDADHAVRIPLGAGAAGRIAVSESGQIFNDLTEVEVYNPQLRQNTKSLVGAPLKVGGRVIGVIHVGSVTPREFTGDDLDLIRLVAHRAALAIERTQLHERERAAREAAEAANRTKDEFLAMLGHELRNPLAAISMSGHLLARADGRQDLVRDAQRIIARQVEQLSRLVDELLDVARVSSGKMTLQRQPIDVATCAMDGVKQLELARQLEGHQVLTETEPAWVDGDRDRLTQIVTNLLSNAAKYTPSGGVIAVSVQAEGNYAVIRVKDSGIGISPEFLPRIFDAFVQGDVELDRAQGGLGVGLTLVRRLAELHGGGVEAVSEGLGRGSTFIVRIPLIAAPAAAATDSAGEPIRSDRPRRILIVEDNADVRESLRDVLELRGHQIYEAEDGPRGVEAMADVRPDVALIDVGLPAFDGYEVARRIRSIPAGRDVILIALTGYSQREYRRKAEQAGFDGYLVKPIDPRELAQLIEALSPPLSGASPD